MIVARSVFLHVLIACFVSHMAAQPLRDYWQQEIRYKMDIDFDVENNTFQGKQSMRYKNNSPDALDRLYFHLYFNAFQPESSMDIRSRTIPDPDPRIGDRISQLNPKEIGYHRMLKVEQQGQELLFAPQGTILEVIPLRPVKPGQTIKLYMEYESQVPVQIRRSGRDNAEDIRYSMAQWYPKMCEYDEMGWHTDPYVGREFYGVWGDFDVQIRIDSAYTVAATGQLMNGQNMGYGYGGLNQKEHPKTIWRFKANHVHDFVWAADPDYIHEQYTCKSGVVLHTFYQDHETYAPVWKALPAIFEEADRYIRMHFGEYPYSHYSVIQGGDGGMEYPMATLITGHRSLISLVGVTLHEYLHSWYHTALGFNESLYYWMDEGFVTYTENRVMNHLVVTGFLPGTVEEFPFDNDFKSYYLIHTRGLEEPLSTHADHFNYNTAYSFAAYIKGSIFLHQLEYVIGSKPFQHGLRDFYNRWKFKHPDASDFIRVMEEHSGMELDWYKEYMVYTTKTIDYAVDTLLADGEATWLALANYGSMPMPVDFRVQLTGGETQLYTIPINLMRKAKQDISMSGQPFSILPSWDWVSPYYEIKLPVPIDEIASITIDPFRRMADMDRHNNVWPAEEVHTE